MKKETIEHVLRINNNEYIVNPLNYNDFRLESEKVDGFYDYHNQKKAFAPTYDDVRLSSVNGLLNIFERNVLESQYIEHEYIVRKKIETIERNFKFNGINNYYKTKEKILHLTNNNNAYTIEFDFDILTLNLDRYLITDNDFNGFLSGLLFLLGADNRYVFSLRTENNLGIRVYTDDIISIGQQKVRIVKTNDKTASSIYFYINDILVSSTIDSNIEIADYISTNNNSHQIGCRFDSDKNPAVRYADIIHSVKIWDSAVLPSMDIKPNLLDVTFDSMYSRELIDVSGADNDCKLQGSFNQSQFTETVTNTEYHIFQQSKFSGLSVDVDNDARVYTINSVAENIYTLIKRKENIKYDIYQNAIANQYVSILTPNDFYYDNFNGCLTVADVLQILLNEITNNEYTLQSELFTNSVNPVNRTYVPLQFLCITKTSNIKNAIANKIEGNVFDNIWQISWNELIKDLYTMFNIIISFDEVNKKAIVENAKTRLAVKGSTERINFTNTQFEKGLFQKDKWKYKVSEMPQVERFEQQHIFPAFANEELIYDLPVVSENVSIEEHKLQGYTDVLGCYIAPSDFENDRMFFLQRYVHTIDLASEVTNEGNELFILPELLSSISDGNFWDMGNNGFVLENIGLPALEPIEPWDSPYEGDFNYDNDEYVDVVFEIGIITAGDIVSFDLDMLIGVPADRLFLESKFPIDSMRGILPKHLKNFNGSDFARDSNVMLINIDAYSEEANIDDYKISNKVLLKWSEDEITGHKLNYTQTSKEIDSIHNYREPATGVREFNPYEYAKLNRKSISLTSTSTLAKAGVMLRMPKNAINSLRHPFTGVYTRSQQIDGTTVYMSYYHFPPFDDLIESDLNTIDSSNFEFKSEIDVVLDTDSPESTFHSRFNAKFYYTPLYQPNRIVCKLLNFRIEDNITTYNYNLRFKYLIQQYHRSNKHLNSAILRSQNLLLELDNRKRIRVGETITPHFDDIENFNPINFIDTNLGSYCEITDFSYNPYTKNFEALNFLADRDIRPYKDNFVLKFSHPTLYNVQINNIDVNNTEIVAYVYAGADITNIMPNIEVSYGATLNGNTEQDYSQDVYLTVVAENGSTRSVAVKLVPAITGIAMRFIESTTSIVAFRVYGASPITVRSQTTVPQTFILNSGETLTLQKNIDIVHFLNISDEQGGAGITIIQFTHYSKGIYQEYLDLSNFINLENILITNSYENAPLKHVKFGSSRLISLWIKGHSIESLDFHSAEGGVVLSDNNMSSRVVENMLQYLASGKWIDSSANPTSGIRLDGSNEPPLYEIDSIQLTIGTSPSWFAVGDEVRAINGSGTGFIAECYARDLSTSYLKIKSRGIGYSTLPTSFGFYSDTQFAPVVSSYSVSTAYHRLLPLVSNLIVSV